MCEYERMFECEEQLQYVRGSQWPVLHCFPSTPGPQRYLVRKKSPPNFILKHLPCISIDLFYCEHSYTYTCLTLVLYRDARNVKKTKPLLCFINFKIPKEFCKITELFTRGRCGFCVKTNLINKNRFGSSAVI